VLVEPGRWRGSTCLSRGEPELPWARRGCSSRGGSRRVWIDEGEARLSRAPAAHPLASAAQPCPAASPVSPMVWQDKGLGCPFQQSGGCWLRVSQRGSRTAAGPARALLWALLWMWLGWVGERLGAGARAKGCVSLGVLVSRRCPGRGTLQTLGPQEPSQCGDLGTCCCQSKSSRWEVAEALMLCAGRVCWDRRHEEEEVNG